jgi:hypothetical protein
MRPTAPASPQEFVRRALEAAEIADGCYDRRIRESFFTLAALRLRQAQGFDAEGEDKDVAGDD